MQTIALIHKANKVRFAAFAKCHHTILCITWRLIPVRAKIALWEHHVKNRKQRKAAKLAWWKQVDNVCDKLFG